MSDDYYAVRLANYAKPLAWIRPDGSCEYDWPAILEEAARWQPGNIEMHTCFAKLLAPLAPK
jgi:hypothetical protein